MEQLVTQTNDPWWSTYVPAVVPVVVSYCLGALSAFSVVQSIKTAFIEDGRPKPSSLYLRMVSGTVATVVTFGASYYVFGIGVKPSIVHAVICGILFPVVITILMEVAAARWPRLYDRLRVAPPRPDHDNGSDNPKTKFF